MFERGTDGGAKLLYGSSDAFAGESPEGIFHYQCGDHAGGCRICQTERYRRDGRRGSDGFAGQSAGGTFGNDEAPAGGAADSLLCIKKDFYYQKCYYH